MNDTLGRYHALTSAGHSFPDNRSRNPVLRLSRKHLTWIVVTAVFAAIPASGQPLLYCVCLRQQAFFALQTNQCVGVIPDLCSLATNCYFPSITPSPGYTCIQVPAPGTVV